MEQIHLSRRISDWVVAGLADYAEAHLPDATPIEPSPARQTPFSSWREASRGLGKCVRRSGAPLARVIRTLRNRAVFFTLALAGAVESRHMVGLSVARLQAPTRSAHPTLHLVQDLCRHLLPGYSFSLNDLITSDLVRHEILVLSAREPLPHRTLSVDPLVWRILTGKIRTPDRISPIPDDGEALVSRRALDQVDALAGLLKGVDCRGLMLRGCPAGGRRSFAAVLGRELGRTAVNVSLSDWSNPAWRALSRYCGWLPVIPVDAPGESTPSLPTHDEPVIVLAAESSAPPGDGFIEVATPLPDVVERTAFWNRCLEKNASIVDPGERGRFARRAAESALVGGPAIANLCKAASLLAKQRREPLDGRRLKEVRRRLGGSELRAMAQSIEQDVTEKALIVNRRTRDLLDDLILRCRRRESLWRGLGPTLACTRNTGVRALFSGPSGAGKTMAAEILANHLKLDLYRIDLSAVVSKYIGETEKNLRRVFDAAEQSGAILFVD